MRILFALLAAASLLAQSAEQVEFFEKEIRPVLATKCYACHGPNAQMGGLNFSKPADLTKVVSPGDAEHSRLYQAISYAEKIKMPPAGKLPDHQTAKPNTSIGKRASAARRSASPAAH